MRKIVARMKNTNTPIDGHKLYLYESGTGFGWVVGGWEKSVDQYMMRTIWKEGSESGTLFPNTYTEFRKAWKDGTWETDGCRYYNANEFDVVKEGWVEECC